MSADERPMAERLDEFEDALTRMAQVQYRQLEVLGKLLDGLNEARSAVEEQSDDYRAGFDAGFLAALAAAGEQGSR